MSISRRKFLADISAVALAPLAVWCDDAPNELENTLIAFSYYAGLGGRGPPESNSRIYTVRPRFEESAVVGANLEQLTDFYAVRPAWSPDGRKIAFVGSSDMMHGSGVYVMNGDGSEARMLPHTFSRWCSNPAWSPDGTRIAFASDLFDPTLWNIYVTDSDGESFPEALSTELLDDSTFDYINPAWMSDDRVFFLKYRFDTKETSLCSYKISEELLADEAIPVGHKPINLRYYPDVSAFLFNKVHGDDLRNVDIYLMRRYGYDVSFGRTSEIAASRGGDPNFRNMELHPSLSPDASRVVFSSGMNSIVGTKLFMVDSDDTNLTELQINDPIMDPETAPVLMYPAWSPFLKYLR
ncbi:MAG: hypothetical protein ABH879_02735 [archaeon]